MAKKRKLNSKNPRYQNLENDNTPKEEKRVLMCEVHPRDERTKEKCLNVKVPVYGIWYENAN
tara:strand:- start:755 stop:940 length:186 start_codon:yes stop_codon:yes gene_type:complete